MTDPRRSGSGGWQPWDAAKRLIAVVSRLFNRLVAWLKLLDPVAWLQLLYPVVAGLFGVWSRIRLDIPLGPNLGFPTDFAMLKRLGLPDALPSTRPSSDLIAEEIGGAPSDAGPTEELRLANEWAAALQTHMLRNEDRYAQRGLVLTTYGFARVAGRVQLSVIQYLRLRAAFRARKPEPIRLEGWTFPVIVRPWLGKDHGPRSGLDGICWVKCKDKDGRQYPAILTAQHALRPKDAPLGSEVKVNVLLPTPTGLLREQSPAMDVAVVEVDKQVWGEKMPIRHLPEVSYKPVEFITSRGNIVRWVIEHDGFLEGTVIAQAGQEPQFRARLIMDRPLRKGDSGCLGVEIPALGQASEPRFYLLYLGSVSLPRGEAGFCSLLEQPRIIWDLEFFC
jgi:hypothetical protein